jgi:Lipopolysaccharide-assembly
VGAQVRFPENGRIAVQGRRLAVITGLVACCGWMLVACGYHFQGEVKLPRGARNVYVEIFENRTNEAGLETTVTNAVVFEFTKRSKSLLAGEPSAADLIMKGVIRSVESKTISPRRKDSAGERLVTLRLDLKLIHPDGALAWEAKGLSEGEAYPVTDDKFQNDFRERRTLALVATRIAERIFNRFTDDF